MRKENETDLTDEQWEKIEPLFVGMRKRKWEKRELVNAVLYLVKTGCQWRNLSPDFPPAFTVHSFYRRARLRVYGIESKTETPYSRRYNGEFIIGKGKRQRAFI